jgi:hypothetical protein
MKIVSDLFHGKSNHDRDRQGDPEKAKGFASWQVNRDDCSQSISPD